MPSTKQIYVFIGVTVGQATQVIRHQQQQLWYLEDVSVTAVQPVEVVMMVIVVLVIRCVTGVGGVSVLCIMDHVIFWRTASDGDKYNIMYITNFDRSTRTVYISHYAEKDVAWFPFVYEEENLYQQRRQQQPPPPKKKPNKISCSSTSYSAH